MKFFIASLFIVSTYFSSISQKICIKNYQLGYQILERDAFGNNPFTLQPLIKNKKEYLDGINSFNYNGFYGNPGIEKVKSVLASVEMWKKNSSNLFWKKFTVKAGFGISNRLLKDNMALSNTNALSQDSNIHIIETTYNIDNTTKQISLLIGITYNTKILKFLQFHTGFIIQPAVSAYSKFSRHIDTFYTERNNPQGYGLTKISQLKTLKGVRIFTSNFYIPLGLQLDLYKKQFFFQSNLNVGLLYNKYYAPKHITEGHSIEFSLIYQPKQKVER